jgi:hypothetical protein
LPVKFHAILSVLNKPTGVIMDKDFNAQFYPDVTDFNADDDGLYPEQWRHDIDDEEDCGDVSGCDPYDEEF